VLRETTSRGLCGLVCPARTSKRGTRCFTTGWRPVFPGSSRLGIQPTAQRASSSTTATSPAGMWSAPRAGRVMRAFVVVLCMFITAVPVTKLFAWEGDIGGHVLRETTSRGLCGLVCPSRTSECGGEGYCVKEGGGGILCERRRWIKCNVFIINFLLPLLLSHNIPLPRVL
jgi:hypothetical protein